MKAGKTVNLSIIVLSVCLAAGIGTFIYNAKSTYKINRDFTVLPLVFNPEDSTSAYNSQDAQIIVNGGFVKGIQKGSEGAEILVIRALSPLPAITVKGNRAADIPLWIENVNPDFYANCISGENRNIAKVSENTIQINIDLNEAETFKVEPDQTKAAENQKYIILGDNRDGYGTFEQIIQQINSENPAFVIDNGDLVFSGKPNQYRLFDRLVSKVSATLLTAPGNHDIRDNGRRTYTMLYGPSYYSFDFGDGHFVFLDSSPGWANKRAVSNEQYSWLERDLVRSAGKRIFVVTHIPPHDPRSETQPNVIPGYAAQAESGNSWFEEKLSNYNENKFMNHGFQDPREAARFENLMRTHNVETVYLSHIHSFFDYTKDGVRYLISGGAGAELLSKNSYYHYIIANMKESGRITMVKLPSPANSYTARYYATLKLFAKAMYKENPVSVVFIMIVVGTLICMLITKVYMKRRRPLDTLWKWLSDIFKYAVVHFKELYAYRKR